MNHGDTEDTELLLKELTGSLIGAAIEVHRELGPGLLESTYQACLAREFALQQIAFEQQKPLPVIYKGVTIDCGYRLDFLVEDKVIIELKAVEALHDVHDAQLLTYLKLSGCKVGLLINFNVAVLKSGIRRRVL
ncbi:MAG: GxxExxY protein [Chthoniobacterales bacterium]